MSLIKKAQGKHCYLVLSCLIDTDQKDLCPIDRTAPISTEPYGGETEFADIDDDDDEVGKPITY